MIINTTTPKGTKITIDTTAKTVSLPSGVATYSRVERKMIAPKTLGWTLSAVVGGKPASIVITDSVAAQIRNAALADAAAAEEAAIPGITLLRATVEAVAQYRENANSGKWGKAPTVSYEDVAAQYPRAAMYLRAEDASLASDDRKAAAGRKATAMMLAGGSAEDAAQMLDSWLA